jgi:hypothetical protein
MEKGRRRAYIHRMATPDPPSPKTSDFVEQLAGQSKAKVRETVVLHEGMIDVERHVFVGEGHDLQADREIHDKAAAYDAFLDALGDDMDRRLAEINATLNRLAA